MMKNTRGIPENAEKGIQAVPAHSWPLLGVKGLQVSPLSPAFASLNRVVTSETNLGPSVDS